jgi:hypothetical protein
MTHPRALPLSFICFLLFSVSLATLTVAGVLGKVLAGG